MHFGSASKILIDSINGRIHYYNFLIKSVNDNDEKFTSMYVKLY